MIGALADLAVCLLALAGLIILGGCVALMAWEPLGWLFDALIGGDDDD